MNAGNFLLKPEDVKGFWSGKDPSPDIVLAATMQAELMEEVDHPLRNSGVSCPVIPRFQMRPGELTVWAGNNGAGKSALMSQVALSMMMKKRAVCLLSFEMAPKDTVMQMVRMAYGRGLSIGESGKVEKFFDWCERLLWVYRNRGAIDPGYALDAVAYAAAVKHCRHVFVDNLMMLTGGHSSDQLFQTQRHITEQLKRIAVETGVHVHLVAHLRKANADHDEEKLPDRYSISGAADISNLADNVVIVFRNFPKEKKAVELKTKNAGWDQAPDTVLLLDKQRKTGAVAKQKLWYEKSSGQFCLSPERQLMELMPKNLSGADLTRSHQADALDVAGGDEWL